MLVYRPSKGNNSVTVTPEGQWTGYSIGGEVINRVRYGDDPNYYVNLYSDLSDNSSWFFKPVTNIDFTQGTTYYRAIYIGPNGSDLTQEYIGSIAASVTASVTAPSGALSPFSIGLWQEGIFTELESKNTITLDTETDSTSIIPSIAVFTPSIVINQSLAYGTWLKVWIKVTINQDAVLAADETSYNYVFNIDSLNIPVQKLSGRLPFSPIFVADTKEKTPILHELIPNTGLWDNVYKVFNKNDLYHVFYFNSTSELHNLIVKSDIDINENKYIDVNLYGLTGNITAASINMSANQSSVALAETYVRDNALITSGQAFYKNIVDIFKTEIEDRSYFYIFYNQLVENSTKTKSTSSSTTDYDFAVYGHVTYNWKSGVILASIDDIKKESFDDIDTGISNINYFNMYKGYEFDIKQNHFISKVTKQDDLFNLIGYDIRHDPLATVELSGIDVMLTDKVNIYPTLMNIWEKDLILNNFSVQEIPLKLVSNTIKTVDNKVENENYLLISTPEDINTDTDYVREVKTFVNNVQYLDLKSPHSKTLKHTRNQTISYKSSEPLESWCTTFSFRPTETISITSGTSTFSSNLATHQHILIDSVFNTYKSIPVPLPSVSGSSNISIFSINAEDSDYKIFQLDWNPTTRTINLTSTNSSGVLNTTASVNSSILYAEENVFNINFVRNRIYDASSQTRYFIQLDVYLNGSKITSRNLYSLGTTDNFVVKYNYKNNFAGNLSYFDVSPYALDISTYASISHKIHANIVWARIGAELDNTRSHKEYQQYRNKRIVQLNNLSSYPQGTLIVPIKLLGKGYEVSNYTYYNKEASRTYKVNQCTFNFSKFDLNNIDFSFTTQFSNKSLNWYAQEYDSDTNSLVVWVEIPNYYTENLILYYNYDGPIRNKPHNPFKSAYGVWIMENFIDKKVQKVNKIDMYASGENFIIAKTENKDHLSQINHPYTTGFTNVYKSNMYDVAYDDRTVAYDGEQDIADFIKETAKGIVPDIMTLNKVKSLYNYKLEEGNSEE